MIVLQRCADKIQNQFLRVQIFTSRFGRPPVQETRPQDLRSQISPAGTLAKKRVISKSGSIPMCDFREHCNIGRDDELVIALTNGRAHAVVFSSSNEDDLVWIANDILAADVPNEESPIWKADLIFRAEVLGAFVRMHAAAAQVLNQTDPRLQEGSTRFPGCILPVRAPD